MRYTTVFWDFNGTVMDDVHHGIRCVNHMLAKRGLPTIDSVQEYRKLFRFPVKEYYRDAGFDFDKEPYEELAVEWVDLFVAGENSLTLCPGFKEVHRALADHGIRQIILSSSEKEMLLRHLRILGMENGFEHVIGLDNIYAGGKAETAKRLFGENQSDAVMIGDTPHDADTARAMGADCILYTGGHSSRDTLLTCGCPVVDNLTDVLKYIL